MRFDTALGATHGFGGLGDIHLLPVTHQKGLPLTGGQLLYLGFDVPEDLGAACIKLVDDRTQTTVDRIGRRDDQGVAGGIGGDERRAREVDDARDLLRDLPGPLDCTVHSITLIVGHFKVVP